MRAAIALAVVSSALLLSGCGTVVTLTQIPPECVPSNSIAVQWGPGRLQVDSECVIVDPGDTVTLTFTPPLPTGGAKTKYRGLFKRWLDRRSGESGNPATIVITAPRNKEQGDPAKSYKYEIHVEGVGVLDPRIVI